MNRVPAEGRGALLARGREEGLCRRSRDDVGPEDEVVEHGHVKEAAATTAAATAAEQQQCCCSRRAGLSEQQGRTKPNQQSPDRTTRVNPVLFMSTTKANFVRLLLFFCGEV